MADRVFLTGATGYIGGRLAPLLLDAGYEVRCLARAPRKLESRPWADRVEVVQGDLEDVASLTDQMRGCRFAYYLVHSMESKADGFSSHDQKLALTFAAAAEQAGVERIIYLGGLGEMGDDLSAHLRSRREVELELAARSTPVTTLRAAMIIGSGSASFEILRYLVERLPVMVTPRWVRTESQPIAVTDVLHYLLDVLEREETSGRTLEIGAADVVDYETLMRIMAEELGLPRRLIVPVPVLTPRLSSLWIGLVTPVTSRIARPLAEGLRNRVVVTTDAAAELAPHETMSVRDAIRLALQETTRSEVSTRWSSAGVVPGDPDWAGGTSFTDARRVRADASASSVYKAACRVGGGHGWYAADVLWRFRGWLDKLAGGPGLRRGRRHPEEVGFGEALDFWRVTAVDRDRRLSLRAEMRLPGAAQLDFDIQPHEASMTELCMTARFRPRGLLGLAYWYAVLPLHYVVFEGMLRGIKREAERIEAQQKEAPAQGRKPL